MMEPLPTFELILTTGHRFTFESALDLKAHREAIEDADEAGSLVELGRGLVLDPGAIVAVWERDAYGIEVIDP